MTSVNDYSLPGTERTGEVPGLVPVPKSTDDLYPRSGHRNGRKRPPAARKRNPPAEADPEAAPAPAAKTPPAPDADDGHVDYLI